MALRGFIYTISADIYAYRFAFSGKTHCILHRFTLRFAPKRTVFCGIYGLCTNLWKPTLEKPYPCHPSQSTLEDLCLWIERLGECVCCPAHKEVEHTAIMLVWGRCNCVETLESQVADLLCLRVKDSLSRVLGGILCENHAQGAFSNGIVRGTLSPLHSLNCVPRIRHIYPTGYSCTASHNIVQIGRCQQCANSLLLRFS